MTDPSRPAGPASGLPPEYPYGGPAADPSLLGEPGSGRPDGDPQPGPGAAGPGYPPPGYAPPGYLPFPPEGTAVRAQAIAALIVSILLVVPCFNPLALPAVVIAAIALGRARTDVPLARILTRVAWAWIAVSVALGIAFLAWVVVSPEPGAVTPTVTPTSTATGSPGA